MIVLDLIRLDQWYGISKEVDFAKGILEIPTDKEQIKDQQYRLSLYKTKKQ